MVVRNLPRRTQADRRARSRSALLESAARGLSVTGTATSFSSRWPVRPVTRAARSTPVQGQGGARAGGDRLGRRDVETGGRPARGSRVRSGGGTDRAGAWARGLLPARRGPRGHGTEARVQRPGSSRGATSRAGGRQPRQALHPSHPRRPEAGRDPARPPARTVALAFFGAMEGTVIELAGRAPHDELLAARAAAGVLGLDPSTTTNPEER